MWRDPSPDLVIPPRMVSMLRALHVALKIVQAVLLFIFWTCIEKYEERIFDFEALLLITDVYRISRDRHNSILLLCLILGVVYIVFETKWFFVSVLAMTVSSLFFEPVDMFYFYMLMKSFSDVIAFIISRKHVSLLRTHMTSRFTDILWLMRTLMFQLKYSLNNYESHSVEDLLLVPLFIFHSFIFYTRSYTPTYFCYALDITFIWMFLKSSTHPRRGSLLTMNVHVHHWLKIRTRLKYAIIDDFNVVYSSWNIWYAWIFNKNILVFLRLASIYIFIHLL